MDAARRADGGRRTLRRRSHTAAQLPAVAPLTIDIPDKDISVRIEESRVWVEHSDCPDQICVRSGEISAAGQSVVCLPNRVVVKITGVAQLDAVVG